MTMTSGSLNVQEKELTMRFGEEKKREIRGGGWLRAARLAVLVGAGAVAGGCSAAPTNTDDETTASAPAQVTMTAPAPDTLPVDMATMPIGAKGVNGDRPPRKVPGLP